MPACDFGSLSWLHNFTLSQDVPNQKLGTSAKSSGCLLPIEVPLLEQKNKEYKLMETQLRSHTVQTHGTLVARRHMYDWLILALLVLIEVGLNVIDPFYRFVGKDMMTDLKYPLKSNSVPIWVVPIYAILLPMVIFLAIYLWRRDVYDLHHAVLGLLFSVVITGVITDAIKDAVGRPRPDFFWRCFPDGEEVYDQLGNVVCHGNKNVVREGHKSFPSGHTSWSFAGLTFLSLYLSGKIQVFDQRGHVAKLCIVFFPLLGACLVGISRVDDYWHHWQDVFAGGLIGLVVATVCYLQFFPPPYHTLGWGTYSYFQVLAELHSNAQAGNPENVNNGQDIESGVDNEEDKRSEHGFMGLTLARGNSTSELEERESDQRK